MASICNTIQTLEEEIKAEFGSQAELANKLSEGDLMTQLFGLVKKYGNDVESPAFKEEAQDMIDTFIEGGMIRKLSTENDKLLSVANAEKGVFKFQTDFEKYLIESGMSGIGDPGSAHVKMIRFLNKTYKLNTLGPALGRIFMEPMQAGMVVTMDKLDMYLNHRVPEEYKGKVPNWGRLNKKESFAQREFGNGYGLYGPNLLRSDEHPMGKFINTLGASLMKLQAGLMDPAMTKMENSLYQSICDRMWMDKVKTPGNEFLVKDKVSHGNQIKKNNILQEIKRKATAEAKKMFFNYVDNPMIIHKLEEYVPFSNFMYSGMRQMTRYPKSMMFIATALNQMQYSFGDEIWYEDEDGQKIDAGVRLRMPILASIGLGNVQLNANRFASFTPTSTHLDTVPLFSFITNRDDYRWKPFYESGKVTDLVAGAFTSMGGPLARLYQDMKQLDKPYKSGGEDHWSDITSTLAYLATGMPIKDKTQAGATQAFIQGDMDYLLGLSDLQLQEFTRRQSRWGGKDGSETLTRRSLELAKKAQELGLMSKKSDTNSFGKQEISADQMRKNIIKAVVGLGIHPNVVDKSQLNDLSEDIMHLADFIVGSEIPAPGKSDFMDFLNKVNLLGKEKGFDELKQFNPSLYNTWKYYIDNVDYYRNSDKIAKIGESEGYGTPKHLAYLLASKYQFEGDDGMSLDQKAQALQGGKIFKVKMAAPNNIAGVPAGPLMTEGYWAHLDNKGALVNEYLQSANELMGYQAIRKFYGSMYYQAKTSGDKNSAKAYWDKSQIAYNAEKKAYDKFHMGQNQTAFSEFLLSDQNQSFQDKVRRAQEYKSNQQNRDAKVTASRFNKITTMSEKEKEILRNVLYTNPKMKTDMIGLEMGMDTANPHYISHVKNLDLFRSIINQ